MRTRVLRKCTDLCRVSYKYPWDQMAALRRDMHVVRNWVLDFQNSLQRHPIISVMHFSGANTFIDDKAKYITWIVFRKFLGSSGSSKGYAPTNMTYKVTPQDHTSAIWIYWSRILVKYIVLLFWMHESRVK